MVSLALGKSDEKTWKERRREEEDENGRARNEGADFSSWMMEMGWTIRVWRLERRMKKPRGKIGRDRGSMICIPADTAY